MDALILRLLDTRSATIPEIADHCSASQETVRSRLQAMEHAGFTFTVHPVLGLTLSESPKHLIGDFILSKIPESRAPRSISVYQSTRSTNDLAHQAALNNLPTPAVFLAEQQTAGRGRNGKLWASDANLGLWMSVLLRPIQPALLWPRITTAAATLVADTLRSNLNVPVKIKWPNDLWIGTAKVAGIIAETGTSAGGPYAVLGIGINVLHSLSDFPPEIRSTATSLKIQTPAATCRNALVSQILESLSHLDDSISDRGFSTVIERARTLSCVLHQSVKLSLNGESLSGRALDLTSEGHLVLMTSEGCERILHSGEVTHIRPSC